MLRYLDWFKYPEILCRRIHIKYWVELQIISFKGRIENELFKSNTMGEIIQWDYNGEVSSARGCFSWMRRACVTLLMVFSLVQDQAPLFSMTCFVLWRILIFSPFKLPWRRLAFEKTLKGINKNMLHACSIYLDKFKKAWIRAYKRRNTFKLKPSMHSR